jgi:hypothetical protein
LAQFQCGLWLLFERYNIAKHEQNKLEGEEEEAVVLYSVKDQHFGRSDGGGGSF